MLGSLSLLVFYFVLTQGPFSFNQNGMRVGTAVVLQLQGNSCVYHVFIITSVCVCVQKAIVLYHIEFKSPEINIRK